MPDEYQGGMQGGQGDDKDGEQPGILPLSVFGSNKPKPGDVCSFEVVQVNDDDAVVRYADDGKEKDGERMGEEATAEESGDSGMRSMMS